VQDDYAERTSESVYGSGHGVQLVVTLRNGERVTSRLGGDAADARARLAAVQRQLGSEQHVLIGEDTVVRADEIRSLELVDSADRATTITPPRPAETAASGSRPQRDSSGQSLGEQAQDLIGYGDRPWAETKPFFLTSEFAVALLASLAVLLAAGVADNFDAPRAWLIVGIVVAAYVVSRGLAKAGSVDPNPLRRDRR
jgi:hypothetical protein